jgi:hypothetical protein
MTSTAPAETLVRDAVITDAAGVATSGCVAFPELHKELLDPSTIEMIVAQTYSVVALAECIGRCAGNDDAHFLVAERGGSITGYLHYDSEGPEPELQRVYVDTAQKRGRDRKRAAARARRAHRPGLLLHSHGRR